MCGWLYHISILMHLQLCVPAYWTDRFDGWRQAEAKLQRCCFVAACVIQDVVTDEVITMTLSYEHTQPERAPQLRAPGNSSSHHRSSHTVIDGIEKVTRARYRGPG